MPTTADQAHLPQLTAEMARRGIRLLFAETKEQAREIVLGMIPRGATVMAGSSRTLDETGVTSELRSGRYRYLRNDVRATDDPELRREKRRQSLLADYFLGGVNAIAATCEIVNIDSSGNRVAGYAFGGNRVIMVAGINKLVATLADAIERSRVAAAVQEARRVGPHPPLRRRWRVSQLRVLSPRAPVRKAPHHREGDRAGSHHRGPRRRTVGILKEAR